MLKYSLYFILFPFYFFSPGSPQIADIFGFLICILGIFRLLKYKAVRHKYFFFFVVYSLIISIIFSFIDQSLYFNFIYYIYAYLLIIELNRWRIIHPKIFTRTIFIAYLLQFLLSFFVEETSVRSIIYFNNPNQLGMFGFLGMYFAYFSRLRDLISRNLFIVFYFISLYLSLLSASKTALICSVLFTLVLIVKGLKWNIKRALFLSFVLTVVSFTAVRHSEDIRVLNNLLTRLETDDLQDDSFEGRGNDRLWKNPSYLIFGAAEGNPERFKGRLHHHEIHSVIPNVLFSYGAIGLTMYLLSLRLNSKSRFLFLLPAILFGISHMVLRIPLYSFIFLYTIPTRNLNYVRD